VLDSSDLSKDAELLLVLRHENQVLRRQPGGRRRWDHAGRLWLAALSRLVNRRRWPGLDVAVLLKIYAHCIDEQAHAVNPLTVNALGTQDAEAGNKK